MSCPWIQRQIHSSARPHQCAVPQKKLQSCKATLWRDIEREKERKGVWVDTGAVQRCNAAVQLWQVTDEAPHERLGSARVSASPAAQKGERKMRPDSERSCSLAAVLGSDEVPCDYAWNICTPHTKALTMFKDKLYNMSETLKPWFHQKWLTCYLTSSFSPVNVLGILLSVFAHFLLPLHDLCLSSNNTNKLCPKWHNT